MKPSATSPCVLAFAELMEQRLSENRHKGGRDGWEKTWVMELFSSLRDESNELAIAIEVGNSKEIVRECADVANYAMMIADVVGGLRVGEP